MKGKINIYRVAASVDGKKIPFIKVKDKGSQLIIAFELFDGEHVTIHNSKKGLYLTYSNKHKNPSKHDEMKVEIARNLGYQDPEKHKDYIANWPLVKAENMEGYHIVGRVIKFDKSQISKRARPGALILNVPPQKAWLDLYLSTNDNPRNKENELQMETSLGTICIELSKALELLPPEILKNLLE